MPHTSEPSRREELQHQIVFTLKSILPSTPVEIVASDAMAIGRLRPDHLAPMSISWPEADDRIIELRAPAPHGPQRNLTDLVEELNDPEAWLIAAKARNFYLTKVDPASGVTALAYVDRQGYPQAVDRINELGGSTKAAVQHLREVGKTQHLKNNWIFELEDLKHKQHQLHAIIDGRQQYWLHINHQAQIYILYASLENTLD